MTDQKRVLSLCLSTLMLLSVCDGTSRRSSSHNSSVVVVVMVLVVVEGVVLVVIVAELEGVVVLA